MNNKVTLLILNIVILIVGLMGGIRVFNEDAWLGIMVCALFVVCAFYSIYKLFNNEDKK